VARSSSSASATTTLKSVTSLSLVTGLMSFMAVLRFDLLRLVLRSASGAPGGGAVRLRLPHFRASAQFGGARRP
jgi:hypothetical protein